MSGAKWAGDFKSMSWEPERESESESESELVLDFSDSTVKCYELQV